MCVNDAQSAYFAGLIDGEGNVHIRTVVRPNAAWTSYAAGVTVVNTDRGVLEEGQRRWGGCVMSRKRPNNRRPCWTWQLTTRKASRLLADIFPYLRIKAAQAELVMELQARIDAYGKPRGGTDAAENLERYKLQQRCREHKQREYNGEYVEPRLKVVGGGCSTCGCSVQTKHGGKSPVAKNPAGSKLQKKTGAPGTGKWVKRKK